MRIAKFRVRSLGRVFPGLSYLTYTVHICQTYVCVYVCMCVIDARPHRWSHRPQTWHGGPSLSWEGLRRVKVGIRGRSRGRERFSAWREAPARQFGRKMSRRAPLRNKQSQNLAPSMDESEQIARKVMNDREMKLELASEAVGRGCPAMWVAK